jgi:hypothetical protein
MEKFLQRINVGEENAATDPSVRVPINELGRDEVDDVRISLSQQALL